MKRIFSLCVVSIAAIGVTAGLATASASATVLCKTAPVGNVCPSSAVYPVGTEFKSSLNGTAYFETPEYGVIQTCTGGTFNATLTSAGGEGVPVTANNTAYTFTGCTRSLVNVELGKSEINWTSGNNGTVKPPFGGRNDFNWNSVFGTCHISIIGPGQLVSSSSEIQYNGTGIVRNSGSCWPTLIFRANYKISSPLPIYVASR